MKKIFSSDKTNEPKYLIRKVDTPDERNLEKELQLLKSSYNKLRSEYDFLTIDYEVEHQKAQRSKSLEKDILYLQAENTEAKKQIKETTERLDKISSKIAGETERATIFEFDLTENQKRMEFMIAMFRKLKGHFNWRLKKPHNGILAFSEPEITEMLKTINSGLNESLRK